MLRSAVREAASVMSQSSTLATYQQTRNTYILRRMFPVRLFKKGQRNRQLKGIKPQVYIAEDNLALKPSGDIDVLLTRVGVKGEVVTLPKRIARNRLLPLGIAVYPSPENLKRFVAEKEADKEEQLKETTSRTIAQLMAMNLPIPMSPDTDWILNENHVRLALRKVGVVAPLKAITIPKEPITHPTELAINLRMNGKHDIKIRAIVYHFKKDEQAKLPPIWSRTKQTLEDALKNLDLK
ncbi:hypothetical protein LSH36_310g03041 [Paralvinella palmiformis]|uniref:Large ribosomal subunit protein bL9m n=1 Tax=Paralvinella palmiformis TaxID=53620 RepID=A0AAD9N2H3_9ANNE|nr:hypothetical protein LSH36_310g03041 [Paralvinella palmiformis]